MSVVGIRGRLNGPSVLGFVMSTLLLSALPPPAQAEQAILPSSPAPDLTGLERASDVTIDELKLHAGEIAELLEHASARVERLAGEAEGNPKAEALAGAVRQELTLSRQWNSHLTSILLEVAEARLDLEIREKKAADEIFELTAVAEEARLELMTLWKSLQPKADMSSEMPANAPATKPEAMTEDLTEVLAGPGASIEEARKTLDRMGDLQKEAAGDIEVVRTKIIDALHTLAPHRDTPFNIDRPSESQIEGSLSSYEITAWAASISSKLHHEGFDDYETARKAALAHHLSPPVVEAMVMEGEVLATTAVRIAPDRQAVAIATVTAGSPLLVTGKVVNLDWYRVEIGNDQYGFVSGDLIKRQKASSKAVKHLKS